MCGQLCSCGFPTLPCVCGRHLPLLLCKDLEPKPCFLLLFGYCVRCSDDASLCPSDVEETHSKGYVLVVGLSSFAACYRHGPLTDEWSRGLLMWTLRFFSLVLIYAGVAVPQFAYAVMVLLLFSWSLCYPLRALGYLRWQVRQWFTAEPLMARYLTDDEYREQAEAETTSALEELRRACCRPDFPSWLAVSRLQAPKKFADFVLGASHLSPEEVSTHEKQYGLGGAFLEEQLFSLPTDSLPAS